MSKLETSCDDSANVATSPAAARHADRTLGDVNAHTSHWWSLLLLPALVAPWLVAAIVLWRGPDTDEAPVSMADATRRRLWAS